ncbi:MAG TPA: tRNA lysidine(34) synthetase TilS [Pseudoneobacillus sp.]|nr:tRNA lysidine(34) synthetase TilS [Pseudoneobacillus sp.]
MLEQKVETFLKQHSINLSGNTVIVGVSGGPDSLTLLHYLWQKREQWGLKLIAAHVDHMFRGEESYLEAVFVKDLCEKLEIQFEWTQINVEEYMIKSGQSTQVGARECRYQFFEKVMAKYNAAYLILGHHGDDQIETMLMRMTRGSSGKARAGIPIRRPFGQGEIIRPLLVVNKDEIENYCLTFQLNPRRDPSNQKPYYSRNRYRLEVIPFLKRENPAVHEQFQRMSEELYQDETFLEELTAQEMNKVVKSRNDDKITLHIEQFLAMPLPLQRRGIQLILKYLYKVRPSSLSALHIDLIMKLMRSPHPSGRLDYPLGLQIIRSYQLCDFLFNQKEKTPYYFELENHGSIELPNGYTFSLEYVESSRVNKEANTCLLDPLKTKLPIIIRTRRNGDRIHPKGMSGTKKIKDIFMDEKIPQEFREDWPIVTDSTGSILWIPQLKKSHFEASDDSLNRYLLLTYKRH